jgi:hypothetical protein
VFRMGESYSRRMEGWRITSIVDVISISRSLTGLAFSVSATAVYNSYFRVATRELSPQFC